MEANRERSEREDFTNPRYRIQSTGPTRLGYETLFRWEIVYLPPATTVFGCWSRYAFESWGLLSVSYLSFKDGPLGCRVDLYIWKKKGLLTFQTAPWSSSAVQISWNFSPPEASRGSGEKSLKRLHVLNHMFIFNIFQFEATLGIAPPFEGLPSFFQDDGIWAPRRPAVSFVPRGLRIKLQLALSWFSPICRPTETENNVRMDTPPKKHGTETLLYLYNNIWWIWELFEKNLKICNTFIIFIVSSAWGQFCRNSTVRYEKRWSQKAALFWWSLSNPQLGSIPKYNLL